MQDGGCTVISEFSRKNREEGHWKDDQDKLQRNAGFSTYRAVVSSLVVVENSSTARSTLSRT